MIRIGLVASRTIIIGHKKKLVRKLINSIRINGWKMEPNRHVIYQILLKCWIKRKKVAHNSKLAYLK